MAFWLVRAGRYGEREDFALQNNAAVIGWEELPDLSTITIRKELTTLIKTTYPDKNPKTLMTWESQLWAFFHDMAVGDLLALPLKHRAVIAIGEIIGGYQYLKDNPSNPRHVRPVKWLKEIPRNQVDPDILISMGSPKTVSPIKANEAERRIRSLIEGKKNKAGLGKKGLDDDGEEDGNLDLEQLASDQIINYINQKFKGHRLPRLVAAILEAQEYIVRISPEGPDGGVDIIAGRGALGFEQPRIVVQVKSQDKPVDVGVLRELQGVINNFGADLGLIVAWSGYKGVVEKEAARQFFKIRLWDADDVVQMLQEHYDQLPETIQAELPLKRIWTLVQEEE